MKPLISHRNSNSYRLHFFSFTTLFRQQSLLWTAIIQTQKQVIGGVHSPALHLELTASFYTKSCNFKRDLTTFSLGELLIVSNIIVCVNARMITSRYVVSSALICSSYNKMNCYDGVISHSMSVLEVFSYINQYVSAQVRSLPLFDVSAWGLFLISINMSVLKSGLFHYSMSVLEVSFLYQSTCQCSNQVSSIIQCQCINWTLTDSLLSWRLSVIVPLSVILLNSLNFSLTCTYRCRLDFNNYYTKQLEATAAKNSRPCKYSVVFHYKDASCDMKYFGV